MGGSFSAPKIGHRGHVPASAKVSPLTAENLAWHEASLERGSTTSQDSAGWKPVESEAVATTTPDASARQEAYRQRKKARKECSHNCHDSGAFLSNLPEVAADVQYRFNFVVVADGLVAQQVVQLACDSCAARKLSSSNKASQPTTPRTRNVSSPAQAFRCLSALVAPNGQAMGENLIKLAFHPVNLRSNLPTCSSRLQALSTFMVFVITIDGPDGKDDRFQAQLAGVLDTVNRLRATTQPKLRPMRVFLLCSTMEDEVATTPTTPGSPREANWTRILMSFDDSHGSTCHFGPLPLQNGDGLHAAFTEMASAQILQNQVGKASEPEQSVQCLTIGVQQDPEVDDGEEAAWLERISLEEQLQLRNERFFKTIEMRSTSNSSSDRSQGWQKPPLFEAEIDGSEVGKETLEAHLKAYGADPAVLKLLNPNQDPDAASTNRDAPLTPESPLNERYI